MIPAVALVRALARLAPSAVDLRNDADDLVVDARGVSVAPSLEDPACAALRAAIDEALTGGAAFVAVTSVTAEGCALARWERPGEAPTSRASRAPASLDAPTLRVHVRERWGTEVVKDFFGGRRPELDALHDAAVAPRCPVTVEGRALSTRPSLARAELTGLDEGMRGAIELVTVDTPATLTLCERGWAVATWPMPPLPGRWYAEEPLRDNAPHAALRDALVRVDAIPAAGSPTVGRVVRETLKELAGMALGTLWTEADASPGKRVVWHPIDAERTGALAPAPLPCRVWIDLDALPSGIDLAAPPSCFDAVGRRAADAAWRSLLDAFDAPDAALPEATQAALRVVLVAAILRDGAVVPPWRTGAGAESTAYRSAAVEGDAGPWLPTPAAVARLAELPLLPVRDGPPVSLHTLGVELARAPIGQLTAYPVRDLRPTALAAEAAHADLAAVDPLGETAFLRRLRAVDTATRTLSAALPWPSHDAVLSALRQRRAAEDDAPTLVIEEPAWEAWSGEGVAFQLRGYRASESVYDAWFEPFIDGVASAEERFGVGTTRTWRWVIRARGTGITRRSGGHASRPRWELTDKLAGDLGRVLLRLATTPVEALRTTFRVTHCAEGVRLEDVLASQGPELFCLGLSLAPSVVTAPRSELELLLGGHPAAIGALTDTASGILRLRTRTRMWVNLASDEALGVWRAEARADPWRRAAVRFVDQVIYRWSRGHDRFRPFAHEREASGALLVLHRGEALRVVPLGATSPLAVGVVDDDAIGALFRAPDRVLAETPEARRRALRVAPGDFSWACHLTNDALPLALCAEIRRAAALLADPAVAAVLAPRLRALRARFRPSGEEYQPVAEALAALPLGDEGPPDALLNLPLAVAELTAAADPSPLALSPERRDALRAWLYRCWRPGAPFDAHHDVLRAAAIWPTISGRYVALRALTAPRIVVDKALEQGSHGGPMSRVGRVRFHGFPADMIVVPTATADHDTAPDDEGPVWTSWHVPAVVQSIVTTLLPGVTINEERGHAPR